VSLADVLVNTVRQVSAVREADSALLAAERGQVSVLPELVSARDATIARNALVIRNLRAELRSLRLVHSRGVMNRSAA